MSILTKVRGLWRHDGDTELVQVSRRSFLFMGGVVVAGLALPPIGLSPGEVAVLDDIALQNLFKEHYRKVIPSLLGEPAYHWNSTGAPWMNIERVSDRGMRIPRKTR